MSTSGRSGRGGGVPLAWPKIRCVDDWQAIAPGTGVLGGRRVCSISWEGTRSCALHPLPDL
jgi:hypothetical protein